MNEPAHHQIAAFRATVSEYAERHGHRIVRFDVNHKGRLSALVEGPQGFEGAAVTGRRDEIWWFSPDRDPRLFAETSWETIREEWWSGCVPTVVAYRPLKRLVVRVNDPETGTRYAKIHRSRLSDERVRIANSSPHFPVLIERRGEAGLAVEVWRDAGDGSVRDCLREGDGATWIAPVAHALGHVSRLRATGLPLFDLHSLIEDTRVSLERGRMLGDGLPDHTERLLIRLSAELAMQAAPTFVTSHGDCHDAQIRVADGEAVLLDPDGMGRAPLEWDVATLAAHLDLAELREGAIDASAVRVRVFEAFCDVVGGTGTPAPERFDALRRLVLLRLAGVYARRPQWVSLVPGLLERAARLEPVT